MQASLARPSPRLRLWAAAVVVCGTLLSAPAAHAQGTPSSFEDLAEKLLPSVVNVSTTAKITQTTRTDMPPLPQFPPGSPFENFFKDFYDQYQNQQQQPREEQVSALGSGFVIDATNGYIVTNNHVIKDADEIRIILQDDTTLDATLVGTDEKTDLAVLKVAPDKAKLVAATWGDSDRARVGSWVLAIGNPFGLGGSVTAGIVSARQRDINAGPYDDYIQTDASINRGNSGGPMFNMRGEVIGVNTAIFSPTGGSVGIGFAVPSNLAANVTSQLIKYGQTRRGWLGVRIQDVTPDIAESLGLSKARGALVSSLTENSPAAKAGIESGDVITSFNGQPIDHMRKLPRLVAEAEVGKKVTVDVWRKGAMKTLAVELGQLEQAEKSETAAATPADKPQTPTAAVTKIDTVGLSVAALDEALRQKHGVPAALNGVIVTEVDPKGIAAERGLAAGDVLVEVDQQDVATPADVVAKIDAAKKESRSSVLFFIARKDDRRFIALKLK